MLLLERLQVSEHLCGIGGAGVQPHHRTEEGRLAAAEVVCPVAVRDVAHRRDQVREVVQHAPHEVRPAALHESHHREVGIPVVYLAETAARHDVGIRQRQQRGIRVRAVCRPGQHGPQVADVLFHRAHGVGVKIATDRAGNLEVRLDEGPQVESRPAPLRLIGRHDRGGRSARHGVHERLAVGEDPGQLHIVKQDAEGARRLIARGRRRGERGRRARRRRGRRLARGGQGRREPEGSHRLARDPEHRRLHGQPRK